MLRICARDLLLPESIRSTIPPLSVQIQKVWAERAEQKLPVWSDDYPIKVARVVFGTGSTAWLACTGHTRLTAFRKMYPEETVPCIFGV